MRIYILKNRYITKIAKATKKKDKQIKKYH